MGFINNLINNPRFILVAALFISVLLMNHKAKTLNYQNRERMVSVIMNAGLFVLLFWKFGPLLTNLSWYLESPASLLWSSGSLKHVSMGIVAAVIYIVYSNRKSLVAYFEMGDLLAIGVSVFTFFYYLLVPQPGRITTMPWGMTLEESQIMYHPLHWYYAIIAFLFLIFLYRAKNIIGSGYYVSRFCLVGGGAILLMSFFERTTNFYAGLATSQYISILLIGCGMYVYDGIAKAK
ncbi:hypothetical protein [Brevibacillus daliensis]|uniref:hypothetical protein n=1 Tax=Brevibacillus daliensis TaxID=2892995 RepID=UPI001E5E321E|nr:hypothetical protein [Brevibacillus daliensis]